MRIRNKPWAMDYLNENGHIVDTEMIYKNNIKGFFDVDQPLYIEVGTGMGTFITELAVKYPDINFLGIELDKNIIIRVVEKIIALDLKNIRLALLDANFISDYLNEGEVSKIYLNFSDPWPKSRHARRRLTYPTFLKQYQHILNDDGSLQFKTDNRVLFEYSLKSMNDYGMKFEEIILDLHDDEPEDNIRTEYEEKFSQNGSKIYLLKASF